MISNYLLPATLSTVSELDNEELVVPGQLRPYTVPRCWDVQ